ncbi:MAG: adenine/guanine/hypoxanthine permease [Solirubrobacteraceae bacterium]|jgi:AGZA family xanthine/uracil permease-like MFS transporter|nr:adenine/guanine/hypoxanthine permease [Solirubrobacteraceae bacterium]
MSTAASIQPPRASKLGGSLGPLWTRGDLNAFFGLGINMLVNVLVIAGLTVGVVHLSHHDAFRVILPALGVELLLGNIFYFMLARRLARKEGRDDVTALPYGPSVPHMFIVTLVIMLPIFLRTHDPIKAWEGGIAWAFVIGVIILIGAFIGPTIRRFTPRAALLGTLAGISITFISMRPAAQMWGALWIALPTFLVIVIGFISGVRLPRNFPVGLAALLLGSAIAWIGGYMDTADVSNSVHEIALGLPSLNINHLINGLNGISPLLATAIPLGIYNFTEAMSNVESAAAAGDSYNLRHVLLADGTGAVIGSALGSPFPPAVYIGHPGWKAAGGRITYSLATGVGIFLFCTIGLFPLLSAVLPIPAIVPILLYIGLVIGAQAFASVPRAHFAAIVLAVVPNVAQWASGLVDSTLSAAGTSAAKVGFTNLENAGVIYGGLVSLGQGAILAGMVLGAVGALVIDRRFEAAAAYCFFGAGLSFIGLIHGPKVGWDISPKIALGYAMGGVVLLAFSQLKVPRREPDLADPIDAADAAAAAAAALPPVSTNGHGPELGVPGAEPVPA